MKWIGPGVLNVGKRDYGYGDTIPTKGISPERIAQFKKLGYIGEVPVAGPDPEIIRLKTQIADLEATAKTVQEGGQKLEAEYKELLAGNAVLVESGAELVASGKEQAKINKELLATIETLEAELKELQAGDTDAASESSPSGDGAGPKSDKKGSQK